MPKPALDLVLSHWYKPFEDFEASPKDFYASVEQAVARRKIPDAQASRVDWSEGGLLSARREYLRITRGKHIFDICAAPFGNGFFFSSWLTRPSPKAMLYAILSVLGVFTLMGLLMKMFGFWFGLFLSVVLVPAALLLVGNLVRKGVLAIEDEILAVPVLGHLYDWIFKPQTYFKIDTALMFQSAVHAAVLEVIDGMTTAKGIRGLTELERKPVMRDFFRR